jgi:hypothetical protein
VPASRLPHLKIAVGRCSVEAADDHFGLRPQRLSDFRNEIFLRFLCDSAGLRCTKRGTESLGNYVISLRNLAIPYLVIRPVAQLPGTLPRSRQPSSRATRAALACGRPPGEAGSPSHKEHLRIDACRRTDRSSKSPVYLLHYGPSGFDAWRSDLPDCRPCGSIRRAELPSTKRLSYPALRSRL